jgi:hypothetical protein
MFVRFALSNTKMNEMKNEVQLPLRVYHHSPKINFASASCAMLILMLSANLAFGQGFGYLLSKSQNRVIRPTAEAISLKSITMTPRYPDPYKTPDLAGLGEVLGRLSNATLIPSYPGSTRGTIEMKEYKSGFSHTNDDGSPTVTLQERGEWELNSRGSKSQQTASITDTEIVGGVRDETTTPQRDNAEMRLKYSGVKTIDNSTGRSVWEYDFEWTLSLNDMGEGIGKLIGTRIYNHDIYEGGLKAMSDTETINADGSLTRITTSKYRDNSGSKTTWVTWPDGKVEETQQLTKSVEKKENFFPDNAFQLEGIWFTFTENRKKETESKPSVEPDLASDDELDSLRKECADMNAKDAAENSAGTSLEQKATLETTIQISVNGKTYDVEVYRWPSRTASGSSVPPRIYIPDEGVAGFNKYQLPAQIANELAPIVLDALNGSLDGSLVNFDGQPISAFEAELLSDKFSLELIQSIRDRKGSRNPFADFNLKTPSKLPYDLVNGSIVIPNSFFNEILFDRYQWMVNLDTQEKKTYRPFIELMERAKSLADSGKVEEAYDLLKKSGYDRYACKLLGYADDLKAKASESNGQAAAK